MKIRARLAQCDSAKLMRLPKHPRVFGLIDIAGRETDFNQYAQPILALRERQCAICPRDSIALNDLLRRARNFPSGWEISTM